MIESYLSFCLEGENMKKKIILVDGHNLLFRMFYGIPSSIKNSKGKEIRGLVGFIGSIKKLVATFDPYSLVVLFDSETSKSNNIILDANYKANRKDYTNVPVDENPFSQLPSIKKTLDFLNVVYQEIENNEADDYIASLIANHQNGEYEYIIVSTDADFIQLIDEKTFLYSLKGKNSILYDVEKIMEKYHILPKQYVLYKALVGDKSDNIDGVRGIGKVTAAEIVKYNSIENYLHASSNARITTLLKENETKIEKNIQLITLNKNLDTSSINFSKLKNTIMQYKTYEIIEKIGER